MTAAVRGLMALAPCWADPTLAPAAVQVAATKFSPTVAVMRTEIAPTAQMTQMRLAGTVHIGATQGGQVTP